MAYLNSLVNLPEGVQLRYAAGINNHGQVIAITFGSFSTIPTIPETEIFGMLLAGLGLVGFMARRKIQDRKVLNAGLRPGAALYPPAISRV
jgi:hypothetical protein